MINCFFCGYVHNNINIEKCNCIIDMILKSFKDVKVQLYIDELNKYIIEQKNDNKLSKKDNYRYQCNLCGLKISSKKNLNFHFKNKVCQKIRIFKCEKCNKGFTKRKNLIYHLEHLVCEKNPHLQLIPQ